MDMRSLQDGALAFGFTLNAEQLEQFRAYHELLNDWNARTNLTAVSDYPGVLTKHFLDSLACRLALENDLADRRLIDVGSGAGFPGLPLKIACPGLRLTLLEATGKKTEFLSAVVSRLGLSDVKVVNARAEEAGHDPQHREVYDLTVARAVAAMSVLAELCLPFVRIGGIMIAQKGDDPIKEVEAAQNALHTLGGRLRQTLPVCVPGLQAGRHLVIMEKVAPTPDRYPRRPGMPAKRPL